VYKIIPTFPDLLARRNYTLRGFCREFGLAHGTLHAALQPDVYPDRVGGVQARTAWNVARAWAQATGKSEEDAYQEVIIEEEAVR